MLLILLASVFLLSACGSDGSTGGTADVPRQGENPTPTKAPLPTPQIQASNPVSDPVFHELPQGRDLLKIQVSGTKLFYAKGTGYAFTDAKRIAYEKLRKDSQANPAHPVQWTFMNLESGQVLAESAGAQRKIFGASTSKVFVAATLLDRQDGQLTNAQMQLMSNMLVVSSNTAWTELQRQIGSGDSNEGRRLVHAFTQRMGYKRTRGFQGWWGSLHGNELTASELTKFLYDTYQDAYPGAEVVWKLLHTVRTGASRGRKYLSKNIFVGGKTGTYDGATVDPETGEATTVRVRNHAMVFYVNGTQYGLSVLADSGTDESAALLAAGLIEDATSSL